MLSPQVTHRAQPTAPAVRAWTRPPARLRGDRPSQPGAARGARPHAQRLRGVEAARRPRAGGCGASTSPPRSLSASGVTRLLEGLEEDGLVVRATCPHDRRVAYAQLTDEGALRLQAASRSRGVDPRLARGHADRRARRARGAPRQVRGRSRQYGSSTSLTSRPSEFASRTRRRGPRGAAGRRGCASRARSRRAPGAARERARRRSGACDSPP